MWSTLYHLIIYPILLTAMRVAALWSPKYRRALRGRGDWRGPISRIKRPEPGDFRVHFHAASVGEFEQAKPIIERLRAEENRYHITASFFSPSGFEGQKDYPLIDGACYIPHDRQGEMNEFINRLTPDLIIILRYDLWLEFMRQAELRSIPVVLACGVMRSDSLRFIPGIRRFFFSLYNRLTMIHCVSEEDRIAFHRLVPNVPVHVSGDTRYDRVLDRVRGISRIERGERDVDDDISLIHSKVGGRKILVAGSTWPEDERLLATLVDTFDIFCVIVPHEPEPESVKAVLDLFPDSIALSHLRVDRDVAGKRTVVVDRMGILAELYQIADIGYVGGGFGAGVHSLLEPAAHGVPLFCGPRIERSRDASALRDNGLLRVIATEDELRAGVGGLIANDEQMKEIAERTRQFVEERLGATERIMRSLYSEGLLPGEESLPVGRGDRQTAP